MQFGRHELTKGSPHPHLSLTSQRNIISDDVVSSPDEHDSSCELIKTAIDYEFVDKKVGVFLLAPKVSFDILGW